ncbi:MAG TPA: phytase, partial [Thermomicrobiales bacterium]|nr:phytase [Thermomicrobiales bacterium]
LAVYDLSGAQRAYYADSEPNNVDLRYNFPLGGGRTALVVTSDADADTLRPYAVDPNTGALIYVAAMPLDIGISAAGLCMYVSPDSGKYYAFVSDNSGTVEQWELFDNGDGKVAAARARTLSVGSVTEGCVADDDTRDLYIAEENVAIWKYGAEPDAGSSRTKVDGVGGDGHLTADIEGLAIYYGGDGDGYLLASSQGSDTFVVYDRQGGNAYVTTFAVTDGPIDGVSHTDGIDVTNAGLGSAFPEGVFIAQDDQNSGGNQNFKLVPWGEIAAEAGPQLTIDTSRDPRRSRSFMSAAS